MPQLNIPNRPERAPFLIPLTHEMLVFALHGAEIAYEQAKANVSTLEEQKMDCAERRAGIESATAEAVAALPFPSQAARDRAEKESLAKDQNLKEIALDEADLRFHLVRHNEDVSVFRHRVLTLRSALDSLGREGGR